MMPRFYLRPSKNSKSLQQLLIIYSHSNDYYKVSAGIPRITENQWDKANSRVINHPESSTLTTMIQNNMNKIIKIVTTYKWENNGKDPAISIVKEEFERPHVENIKQETLDNENEKMDNIYHNYELFYQEKKTKIRAPAHYKLVGDNLKEFLKGQNVLLQDIDKKFLKNFLTFYINKKKLARTKQTNRPYGNRTIKKRLKNFKGFLKWMEIDQKRQVNPDYKTFEIELVETEKRGIILEGKEFKKTVEAEKHIQLSKKLEYVRDLYIIQCLTGLRYCDVKRIRKHMIKGTKNKYLEIDVKKIKKIGNLRIPLLPIADRFLKKYNYDLKEISVDKYNEYIEELFKQLGFNEIIETKTIVGYQDDTYVKKPKYELLRSHSCRRFFISFCVENGVPDKQIMEWTGLSKLETYHKYITPIKIGENRLRQGVSKMMQNRKKE